MKKPAWLKKRINATDNKRVYDLLSGLSINTICEQALCPNLGECFKKEVASFLIMGKICTRNCGFCGVRKGKPQPLDNDEPLRVARAIKKLKLKYVVITSVTRDDLVDQGAAYFCKTIRTIKSQNPGIKIEVLIPDFDAKKDLIRQLVLAKPDVIAHNVETVKRLYPIINRDMERYEISLKTLRLIKECDANFISKSGFMLGLGEQSEDVYQTMQDLRDAGCEFLSIGQYLAPDKTNVAVKRYVHPQEFSNYKEAALKMGFKTVKSAPYIRSSYLAHEYHKKIT